MKPEVQKLLWRARRGMLELDTLFRSYLMDYGDTLSNDELELFERLLGCQDQDLFEVFSGKKNLPDEKLDGLFQQMISRVKH